MRKLFNSISPEIFGALLLLVVGISITLIMGLLFSLFTGKPWDTILFFFFFLGAPCFVGAFVALSFKVSYCYGISLYYGTIVIASMLKSFIPNRSNDYFISFIIMSLICYCFFLKQKVNKSKLDDSDK